MACNKKYKITRSKFDRRQKYLNPWKKVFDEIEAFKIPLEKQDKYVREQILTDDTYCKMKDVLNLQRRPSDICSLRETPSERTLSVVTLLSDTKDGEKDKIYNNFLKNINSVESIASFQAEKSIKSEITQCTVNPKIRKKTGNPYINFLKKPEDKACIWTRKTYEEPSLIEKTEAKKKAFVGEFCSWLNTLGGTNELNEYVISKMFRVDMNVEAARPLRIFVKQLPSVPNNVAQARQCLHNSRSEVANLLFQNRIKAEQRKPRYKAFSRSLPKTMQVKPPRNQTSEKWMQQLRRHDNLESMANVWHSIVDLKSTRAYCEWLLNNPKYSWPPYLKKVGCLSSRYKNALRYSLDASHPFHAR